MSYSKTRRLNPFSVWRERDRVIAITTCRHGWFTICGCWAVKLIRPEFGRHNESHSRARWKLEGYFFKLWFSLVSRVNLRTGIVESQTHYGIARRPAVESLSVLGGLR